MSAGIYFYGCPDCENCGRKGWHALHLKTCIHPECQAQNEFYRQEQIVDTSTWEECRSRLSPELYPEECKTQTNKSSDTPIEVPVEANKSPANSAMG
jgi:hypothetical protein